MGYSPWGLKESSTTERLIDTSTFKRLPLIDYEVTFKYLQNSDWDKLIFFTQVFMNTYCVPLQCRALGTDVQAEHGASSGVALGWGRGGGRAQRRPKEAMRWARQQRLRPDSGWRYQGRWALASAGGGVCPPPGLERGLQMLSSG